MERNDEPILITYDEIVHETGKARLYQFGAARVWLPLSLITDDNGSTVEIPEWLAISKEIEGYAA